ncbi:MAG: PTS sugar transporter subunit IIA [Planctomycetota bacterium]|jgi:fructose-specific phosphotransferase system IIA component
MTLTQILPPDCVKVHLQSNDKEGAITELVDMLDAADLLLDKDLALKAILMREQTRSTGIGSGIAIPHGKCKAVKELIMAIGIAKEPIEFESVDGTGVSIIFLLVSPVDQTGPHIQALARISRLMLDDNFRENFTKVSCAEQIYQALSEKETS